ncbi:MAG: leucine-rich repeat domain-containing protein, partial [Clostridia bacterium]|nr:leucine-rich repeat domain-containing protein [Clostridia bacterium]
MKRMTPKNFSQWALLLAVVLFACALCISVGAQPTSGNCGERVTWTLEGGVLTISGSGPMEDYGYDTAPWFAQRGDIKKIVIESGVTSVGNFAFNGCVDLTEVVISEGVTDIGNSAFNECISLRKIPLPESVTVIDGWAFAYCRALEHISFGSNVKSIGEGVLGFNKALSSITVDGGNTAYRAINNCLIETASGKLLACCRTSILPDDGSVKIIGENVFGGQTGLSSIVIPEGVVSIGANAFRSCSNLTRVTFPKSLMSIENAFSGCEKIATVTVAEGNPYFRSENNCLIRQQDNSLVLRTNNGVIPEGVNVGGMWDAAARWSLTDGVLTVWASSHGYVGDNAWYDMNVHGLIRKAVLEDGVGRIPGMFFANCENLTEVVIPDSVIVIYVNAFQNCSSLTEITLGTGVRNIENGAFNNCTALKRVIAPADSSFYRNEGGRLIDKSNGQTVFEPISASASQNTTVSQGATVSQVTSSQPVEGKITWTLKDGVLTVSGSGPMPDYEYDGAPWYSQRDSIKKVVIKKGVTAIGDYAFYGCASLTEVVIPEGVTRIGNDAFCLCTHLKAISLPESLSEIGTYALAHCYDLESISFGKNVQSIGESVLAYDENLSSITVDVRNTAYKSVGNCLIETASGSLIAGCGNSVIPDDGSVTIISQNAFSRRKNLERIVIPEGVRAIVPNAFRSCHNLKSITIPKSVKTILNSTILYGCEKLETIIVDEENPYFRSENNCLIRRDGNSLVYRAANAVIPDGVKVGSVWENGSWSFDDDVLTVHADGDMRLISKEWKTMNLSEQIQKVVLKNGVTGVEGFNNCPNITEVSIPNSVTQIGEIAFYGCHSLSKITIPDSVKTIAREAFGFCHSMTEIVIPDSVMTIGDNAFIHCAALTSVTVGAGVTEISPSAFSGCDALKTVTVDPNNKVYRSENNCIYEKTSGKLVFQVKSAASTPNVPSVPSTPSTPNAPAAPAVGKITWTLEDGTLTISGSGPMPDYPEYNSAPWYSQRASVTRLVIEEGVTEIGTYAFSGCLFKEIVIPDHITRIRSYAFSSCFKLESLTLGNGVTHIDEYAFRSLDALKSVEIPDNVTHLADYAFAFCNNMTSVTIGDGVKAITEKTLSGLPALESLSIGAGVSQIAQWAFRDHSKLRYITVDPENEYYRSDNNYIIKRSSNGISFAPKGEGLPQTLNLSGKCGESVEWKIVDNTLIISGSGEMETYKYPKSVPWTMLRGGIYSVVV